MAHAHSGDRSIHLSLYHRSSDVRVYHKECLALAQAGYEVHALFADSGPADGLVRFHQPAEITGRFRLTRLFQRFRAAWRMARCVTGGICHFQM